MGKVSSYATKSPLLTSDYVLGVDATGPKTKRFLMADMITLFLNNIPATEGSFGYISSGLVWTADAAGSTRAASMTAGRIRVNTSFLAISAVTARVFTASKDTYIDVLDNLDGTGTLVYTEVTNNAASAAVASNSLRIGIIVTGASNIATAASVNQGQEDRILPIVSSVPYAVTDSLGNLICPRDPNYGILGWREIKTNVTVAGSSTAQATGLSCPFKVPASGRKIEVEAWTDQLNMTTGAGVPILSIWEGTAGSGTQLSRALGNASVSGYPAIAKREYTPSSTSLTANIGLNSSSTGTAQIEGSSSYPAYVQVKLK